MSRTRKTARTSIPVGKAAAKPNLTRRLSAGPSPGMRGDHGMGCDGVRAQGVHLECPDRLVDGWGLFAQTPQSTGGTFDLHVRTIPLRFLPMMESSMPHLTLLSLYYSKPQDSQESKCASKARYKTPCFGVAPRRPWLPPAPPSTWLPAALPSPLLVSRRLG